MMCSVRTIGLQWVSILCLALLPSSTLFAQNVSINTTGAAPNASALLDVDASGLAANAKRGLLIPRMTTAERTAITTPATALLVYDTTTNGFWYFNGTAWVTWALSGSGWITLGNAGLVAGTNFIGTTDNVNVQLRVNNQRAGHLADGIAMFGARAGVATGADHTAFGYQAAQALQGVAIARTTAVGYRALALLNGTADNTAIGSDAMSSYVDYVQGYNTAVGHRALASLDADYCTAVGYEAATLDVDGRYSTAVGSQAQANSVPLVSSGGVTSLGYQAGLNGSTGAGRSAATGWPGNGFGAYAVEVSTEENIGFGYRALDNVTSGFMNTAIGYVAMSITTTTSERNTAIGALALGNTTGDLNVALGYDALGDVGSGSYNTGIGALAGPTTTTLNYTGAIGYNAVPTATGRIVFGTVANNNLTGGYGAWQNPSDLRFKRNIREDVPGIEFIGQLHPATYHLNAAAIERFTGGEARLARLEDPAPLRDMQQRWNEVAAGQCTGLLAQDVAAALDSLSSDLDVVHRPAGERDHYTLSYSALVAPLVRTVQQNQARIDALRADGALLLEQLELLERSANEREWKQPSSKP